MPNQNRCTTANHPVFKTSKLRGEWAELRFMARAAELGIMVSRPWGDSAPYDCTLERNGHFLRVQVKSTTHQRGRSFKCRVSASLGPYAPGELDFIAAYVIPADIWYIIPAHAAAGKIHVLLSPHLATAKYSPYREAWHLLL